MVLTGVRTVRLPGLWWSDFDFEKRLIHIRRNGQRIKRTEDEFTKDYKKMTDAKLHSSFLVLPTGIESITNP